MKKRIKLALTAVLTGSLLLSGCSKIEYEAPPAESSTGTGTSAVINEPAPAETEPVDYSIPDKYQVKEVNINEEAFSQTLQLEDVCTNTLHTNLMGYEGDGFIQIDTDEYAEFTVHVPSTQYYKLTLYMCAFDTGVNVIIGGNKVMSEGGFETFDGVSKGVIYADNVLAFTPFSIEGIYLKKGDNKIVLQSVGGAAYMDMVKIENGRSVSNGFYTMSNSPANPDADIKTIKIMGMLSDFYGKQTLTGQKVTPGTNAEIAAIYEQTGRLPAIRQGDLSCTQSKSPDFDARDKELELAKDWSDRGGLVAYGWNWYAPSDTSHYLSVVTDFDFSAVSTNIDISEASLDTVEALYGSGDISRECYRLIQDMDEAAAFLKELQESGVTVLFSPLPDGGKGGYWWSIGENYQWLWRTLFNRFSKLHGLTNLIWVWSGGSEQYFPGDQYVDIVGENIYNTTGDSGNGRFMGTIYYKSSKAAAMTHCLTVPDPDVLAQDNALWLWFSLDRGDCIIDSEGKLTGKYTSNETLDRAYNSEGMVTLDELSVR
ncbi:MAG: hypothetical protein HDT44_07370 [Ruminococcaceae bacterium]|nr:hypothetical protein [Oscillospiraceae bacterium]